MADPSPAPKQGVFRRKLVKSESFFQERLEDFALRVEDIAHSLSSLSRWNASINSAPPVRNSPPRKSATRIVVT